MNRKIKQKYLLKKKEREKKKLVIQCPWLWKAFISYYKIGDRTEKYKFESVYVLLQAKGIL